MSKIQRWTASAGTAMTKDQNGDWCISSQVTRLEQLHTALNGHAMSMLDALRYVATPEDDDDPEDVKRMALAAVHAFMNDTRFWFAVDLDLLGEEDEVPSPC